MIFPISIRAHLSGYDNRNSIPLLIAPPSQVRHREATQKVRSTETQLFKSDNNAPFISYAKRSWV